MATETTINWRRITEPVPDELFEDNPGYRTRIASLLMWYRRGKRGFWGRAECISYPHSPLKWPRGVTHWAPDLAPPNDGESDQ